MQCNFHKINLTLLVYLWAWSYVTCIRFVDAAGVAIASYVGCIWCFIICFRVSFQCNVLFFVSLLSLFFLCPPNSILSRTGKKENQDASNLTVPMTMCLFPVPFPLTPSKTAGQFHQPYCYSLPPLQRPARCTLWTWPAKSWCSLVRLPFFGLSRPLRDFGDSPGSSSFTTAWPTWWAFNQNFWKYTCMLMDTGDPCCYYSTFPERSLCG